MCSKINVRWCAGPFLRDLATAGDGMLPQPTVAVFHTGLWWCATVGCGKTPYCGVRDRRGFRPDCCHPVRRSAG